MSASVHPPLQGPGTPEPSGQEFSAPPFAQVYTEHAEYVRRLALRLGLGIDEVDDLVQDVFVVVARRLPEFEGRSELRTWIFAITVRRVRTYRRTWARQRRKARAAKSKADAEFDPYARADAARTVHRLLSELSTPQREAFTLVALEGMTAAEAARALGVELTTVQGRVRGARRRLEQLGESRKHGAIVALPLVQLIAEERQWMPGAAKPFVPAAGASAAGAASAGSAIWMPAAVVSGVAAAVSAAVFVLGPGRDEPPPVVPPAVVDSQPPIPSEPRAALAVPRPPPSPAAQPEPELRVRPTATAEPDIEAEMALLDAARRALGQGQPDVALRSLRAHARRFPTGLLREERMAELAVAMCLAGEAKRGAAALRDLRRQFPSSAHLRRAGQACKPKR